MTDIESFQEYLPVSLSLALSGFISYRLLGVVAEIFI